LRIARKHYFKVMVTNWNISRARATIARIFALFTALFFFGLVETGAQQVPRGVAIVADIEGAIGPAASRHVADAVDLARNRSAEVLILRINTPGGLVTSTREIITEILESPVPVVGYVSPSGGHAASAGLYILYACHVAAMAPGTNTGSATPVQIGVPSIPRLPELPNAERDNPDSTGSESDGETPPEDGTPTKPTPSITGSPMDMKTTNDAVAYIRSLAQLHGRNADWAEDAVREAANLPANEALDAGVVDLIAVDLDDLLAQLDGRRVNAGGLEWELVTSGLAVELIEPSTVTEILKILSNPNIAMLLILIGLYGLIFEFSNPGVGPGVIGAICLVLGLYSINQLPVNYAGFGLILLGVGLMVFEAVTPSFGILGLGGIAAFAIGSAILIDTDIPEYQVSWSTIAFTSLLSLAVLSLLFGYVWRTFHRPVRTGQAALLGATAEVIDWSDGTGHVWAQGERWDAIGPPLLSEGNNVRVSGLRGLTLEIQKTEPDDVKTGELS
jgi:membrane-bound serine protease (ClpP class)